METRYDYDIIRDYLHGLVDQEKAREVGDLIRNDEIARDIAEGILRLEREFDDNEHDLETYLENFRIAQLKKIRELEVKTSANKKRNLWLKIAAACALLLITTFAVQRMTTKPEPLALINNELTLPYPVSTTFRGTENGADYRTALELYRNKKYVQASLYFEKAAKTESDLATVTFYDALSALYSGHYNRAITLLESRAVSVSRYSQQARWYLSLACIKADKTEKGIELLRHMSNAPHHYKHDSAVQLLEALEAGE